MPQADAYFPGTTLEGSKPHGDGAKESQGVGRTGDMYLGEGIMKTVTTLVGTDSGDESDDLHSVTTTVHKSVVQ